MNTYLSSIFFKVPIFFQIYLDLISKDSLLCAETSLLESGFIWPLRYLSSIRSFCDLSFFCMILILFQIEIYNHIKKGGHFSFFATGKLYLHSIIQCRKFAFWGVTYDSVKLGGRNVV